jgi:ribose transport system substrate-binding protein
MRTWSSRPIRRTGVIVALLGMAGLLYGLSGVSAARDQSAAARAAAKPVKIAFLTFAVANSYDQPMLAAAKAAAKADGAQLSVLDANNNPTTQVSQLQTAVDSGQYNAIITEPIYGPGLIPEVKVAIKKGIKVADVDEILGTNLRSHASQVPGLAANIVFVPYDLGHKMGQLTVKACKARHISSCQVGFMYDFKATPFDTALREGYNAAIAGHHIKVVAQGQSDYTITVGYSAAQNMFTANPNLNVVVGADQGIEGTQRVAPKNVILIGYGGSHAALQGVASGAWYGDVVQLPASEGRDAVNDLVKAVRNGKTFPGVELSLSLPGGGIVTRSNAKQFHAEWQG